MQLQNLGTVVARITSVCEVAAPRSLLQDLRRGLEQRAIPQAVTAHDTAALYDWLMPVLSYQGVSDAVAWRYLGHHGGVSFAEIAAPLAADPACHRLRSYWDFAECRFTKAAFTCGAPWYLEGCPLPRHDLRNGRLNQAAYSLSLFLRDVCDGDFVAWLDAWLLHADQPDSSHRCALLRQALLKPLSGIYGVSAKVLSMALADSLPTLTGNVGGWPAPG